MAIIRPIGIPISRNFYNSQEIGLARGLSLCGVAVDVYVAGGVKEVVCQTIDSTGECLVRLFEVPFKKIPMIDQAIYPELAKLLSDGDYDFIQVNEENELTSFLVARYAHKAGIPVVVYQGMYQQLTGRIYAAFQAFYDLFFLPVFRKNISFALVKTRKAGSHLERKGFENIKLIPVGIDPTPFAEPLDRKWREENSIPSESTVLLYVGIFERRRNVDFMVDLAKRLADEGVFLLMAGVGPEHERIAARVSSEGISNIRLLGSVSQAALPSLYRQSSVFLLPSNYEIYGMVVIEAMYFGLPVISTRTAGPEDIIDSGSDGILLDGLNLEQWAHAIQAFIGNDAKRQAMGEAAANKVLDTLTWEVIAKDYRDSVIYAAQRSSC
jgi:glycosyltransferase involved in cell wall biosynthesis